jgi:RNA polymerase-binding transcription factor DksA
MNNAYLKEKRRVLLLRREHKTNILQEGGEQSLSHSWSDITRIDFALKRIDSGQYGLCCNCGCGISEKRLTIIPEAVFCTDCTETINT